MRLTRAEVEALCGLRPMLINVIGFYDLLYETDREPNPLQRLTYEAHFATSAHELAVRIHRLIDGLIARGAEDE